jgi:hypothetical protein
MNKSLLKIFTRDLKNYKRKLYPMKMNQICGLLAELLRIQAVHFACI